MTTWTLQIRKVILIIQENTLLAATVPALDDVRDVPREEFEQLVIRLIGETLLEDVDMLLVAQVEVATVRRTGELVQPALTDDDVEVILQALEAKPMLAWQCATSFDLMFGETDGACEHWAVLLLLRFQLLDQLQILLIHILDMLVCFIQVCAFHHAKEVSLHKAVCAACNLRGRTINVMEAMKRSDPLRPVALETRWMGLCTAMQGLQNALLAKAQRTRYAERSPQVACGWKLLRGPRQLSGQRQLPGPRQLPLR
mmetsp:Transcript_88522/g.166946  ORF Transcript_88522/g.166946 Transcript_88522/m.166946 type:complete len:256 (-) Transcript_88522:2260-3027(-)